MKIKVSEATSIQLDWLVATIEKLDVYIPAWAEQPWLAIRTSTGIYRCPQFSTDWAQGGPILEKLVLEQGLVLRCWVEKGQCDASLDFPHRFSFGPTPLIAAMRCLVASKLSDEVEIPEELS